MAHPTGSSHLLDPVAMIDEFRLDPLALEGLALSHAERYRRARPFPHVVIDDFVPSDVASAVLGEFPAVGEVSWFAYDSQRERKLEFTDDAAMRASTRQLLGQLNSSVFIGFLERLTGIDGLVPDPHYVGGGLHQIEAGGYLDVHADFNRHPRTGLERRLNLLLYLNRDWREEYGGHLELWDRSMRHCEARILPVFNRCVIFSTDRYSYHGHPHPLECPPDRTRKSVALYYYSAATAEELAHEHGTLFQVAGAVPPSRQRSARTIERAVPPILLDAARALRVKDARRTALGRWLPPAALDRLKSSRLRRARA